MHSVLLDLLSSLQAVGFNLQRSQFFTFRSLLTTMDSILTDSWLFLCLCAIKHHTNKQTNPKTRFPSLQTKQYHLRNPTLLSTFIPLPFNAGTWLVYRFSHDKINYYDEQKW